ncbi:MAG TPA: PfkB family carbohydrate kinase, partial [Anaerolineales bacterium]
MDNEALPPGAVVAGHICLDIIPDLEQAPVGYLERLLQPGRLVEIGPANLSAGGAVSNTGLALDRLGVSVRLAAKVGVDALGPVIRSLVNSYHPGLADGILSDSSAGTSYTLILSPPGVDRIFLHYPGANDRFFASDIPYELLAQADLFHFGYPPLMQQMHARGGEELVEVLKRAKATGVTVSLDTAFPDPDREGGKADWRAIFRAALPFVDIFLPSLEELMAMLRPDEYRLLQKASPSGILGAVTPELLADVSAELIALGVRVVVIKLGERGLYLRTAKRTGPGQVGRALSNHWEAWLEKELWA